MTWSLFLLDLTDVTDAQVAGYVEREFALAERGTDRWQILGATSVMLATHSFIGTRTYPRPDHPDPRKRLPLSYLVAAVLVSLRTTLENEMRAMDRLIESFPTERQLLNATADEIAVCIGPAGMAASKSNRIVGSFKQIATLDDGLAQLRSWPKERARDFLLSLPGFGPKAADCVLTIGLGIPSMVVDINVFRIATALLGMKWPRPASYSNASQVLEVKRRLDDAVGDDAFMCQIVHTTFLLEGRNQRSVHTVANCRARDYCRSCRDVPSLF